VRAGNVVQFASLRILNIGANAVPNRPPVFHEEGHTYVADTCDPLVQAVARGRVSLHALVRGHYPGRKLPVAALPGLKSVGLWNAAQAQDWGLAWHRNEGIELTLLDRGRLPFSVDGQDFKLKTGDLTITRPWQLHRVGDPHIPAGRLLWLILDVGVRRPHQSWKWPAWLVLSAADMKELTHILRHNEQPVWHAPEELRKTFQRVGRHIGNDEGETNLSRLTVALNELLVEVLEMGRRSNVPLDISLSSSCRTVEMFLLDLASGLSYLAREWTVPQMARECGLGTTQFIHHCKQITNVTPLQYLNDARLEAARRMLGEQPARSVTEVALDCGFSSSQYFATVFRRRFGISPHESRRDGPQG
jgi:AraC-like DNA-binding protein